MPERIRALFANTPADRERLCLTLVDAGLFEELAKLRADSGLLHEIELPNEEAAQRLLFGAGAHGRSSYSVRILEDTVERQAVARAPAADRHAARVRRAQAAQAPRPPLGVPSGSSDRANLAGGVFVNAL